MKAKVHNDYIGTVAADKCDLFVDNSQNMVKEIFQKFKINADYRDYTFVGISVCGTQFNEMSLTLYFEKCTIHRIVKCTRESISIQDVMDLFKRFEFQVGDRLERIDDCEINEI